MEIRRATESDADAIASVLDVTFREFERLYTRAGYAATTPNAARIRERLAEGPIWVAVNEAEVVATVGAVARADGVYVRSMGVAPRARGQRAGHALMRELERFARDTSAPRMYLSTTPFLFSAIRLYERLGFRRTGEPPDELHGTPLVTMARPFATDGRAYDSDLNDGSGVMDFLEQVATERREHVTSTRPAHSEKELIGSFPENVWTRARREGRGLGGDGANDAFTSALLKRKRERRMGVIAEIKRVSPAQGALAPDLDPAKLARAYEAAGATAISVLTEPTHWKGSLDDLARVRDAVRIPVLCKDVIVSDYQVLEARARGADAILLIADLLDDDDLASIAKRAKEFHVGVLVEAHERTGFERAVALGELVVGVNARNLRHPKEIDRTRIQQLHRLARPDQVLVAESGIESVEDARRLPARVDAVLVGSALVRAADPRALVEGLTAIGR